MQYAQAINVLRKMQSAAPPTASARLGEVIELMITMYDANVMLVKQIGAESPPAPPPPTPPADPLLGQAVDVLLPALTVLRGQVNAVRSGKLGRLNAEQVGALALAEQQADAGLAMIDSLDVLTRLRADTLDVHLEPFDGTSTLQRAWDRMREKAQLRGHQATMRIDEPLPPVIGDSAQILTILCDLLDNSILYTPFGGVIRITADTLGTHVLFGIEDNGVGLSPTDKVGEPFWRGVRHSLVRQQPGAGLRVFLARHLLAMMGGELFFSGEPNEGSTFSFTLPVAR